MISCSGLPSSINTQRGVLTPILVLIILYCNYLYLCFSWTFTLLHPLRSLSASYFNLTPPNAPPFLAFLKDYT